MYLSWQVMRGEVGGRDLFEMGFVRGDVQYLGFV